MGAPSTDSVTVLCAETAYPPAKVNVSSVAAKTPRSMGERASSSLFNAFKVSIPTNLIRGANRSHRPLVSQNGNEKRNGQQLCLAAKSVGNRRVPRSLMSKLH